MGRIYVLKVSTRDRNLAINLGVFSGKRWAVISLIPIISATNIIVNHMGKPVLRVTIKCEVIEIVYGAAPYRFIMIIDVNVGAKTIMALLSKNLFVDLVNIDEMLVIIEKTINREDGEIQYIWKNMIVGKIP